MELKDLTHIRYRRLGFSVNEYFLEKKISLDADINYFIQCPGNIQNALSEFYTLLVNLNQPIEAIREGVYHRTLTEIHSFINNQDFEHKILLGISEKELRKFICLFDEFARGKKIRKAETFRLRAYNKAGILAISYIKQKDNFLCINFYRLTKNRAANISSFPVKAASLNNSRLGRANRALHWLDLIEFRNMGVNYYDFCGWYQGETDAALLNINKFKEQFTKLKVKEYTGVVYKNKFLLLLMKLFRYG